MLMHIKLTMEQYLLSVTRTSPDPSSGQMSALPFVCHVPQCFGIFITYPHHEFPIESKVFPTLFNHKTTNVLGIFVVFIDACGSCQ
jgi:hypothetical protein